MKQDVPLTRDLLLIGGGHAHALVLRAWGMDPLPGARLTVVNPGPTAPYTGMLPGYVAGHYSRDELEIDLGRLCRHAGARLILDKAIGIDRAAQRVTLGSGRVLDYDVASINIGITARMDLPGFAEHAIGAKPLDRFAAAWRAFVQDVVRGDRPPQVAVIGGGVAGVELAMAMAHALAARGQAPQVTVLERGAQISGVGPGARQRLRRAMEGLGVDLRAGAEITQIAADHVALADGSRIPAAFCVGAAGAFPHGWIAGTDLPQEDGFIEVGRDFAVRGESTLFAVGDCAVMPAARRPKAGVFAVRAAPVLKNNLRAALGAGFRKRWQPQKNYLKLISLGGKSALAEKFGLSLAAPALWQWKDRIDRAFMDRLADLPPMTAPAPQVAAAGLREALAAKPLCGGCGAKVGGGVLAQALAALPAPEGDVITGRGDDAAILRQPGGGFQVMSTDHLRAFVSDPYLMARIAAVHALGDVWAMGARPQVALASIILPQMSPALQARSLREVTEASSAVLRAAGAQLVGGHTTMGAELTLGFTVTGTCTSAPLRKGGAQAGDHLILTRPIGSGVLLAADMQGAAPPEALAAALRIMATPQAEEAGILAPAARAMTDVTGFGLAGHVAEICAASGLDAVLQADQVPLYDGARDLDAAGVASSLMPANRADTPVLGGVDDLLHDPQTAGGLLAAVPADQADALVAALEAAGKRGWVIGTLRAGPGAVHLR